MRYVLFAATLVLACLSAGVATGQAPVASDTTFVKTFKDAHRLWERTCVKRRQPDGACLSLALPPRPRVRRVYQGGVKRCGPRVRVTFARRAASHRATRAINAVLARYKARYGNAPGVSDDVRFAQAGALFLGAQPSFERFFTARFPAGLDFDAKHHARRKASMRRFQSFMGSMKSQYTTVQTLLAQVIAIKTADRRWALAATYQTGQLAHFFAAVLANAPIPRGVRVGPYASDKISAYCDELAKVALPLFAVSHRAYSRCTRPSTQGAAEVVSACVSLKATTAK